jgi:hypothetical protein
MTKLTLSADAAEKLRQVDQRVEVFDEAGNSLGHFTPSGVCSIYDNVQIPFSLEELRRFASEPGGRPLAEIIADLEKRS